MTIGQQIGQSLYLKVQQGVGDQSQTNVILEYELTKWLRLQTNVVQGSATQQSVFRRVAGHRRRSDLLLQFLARTDESRRLKQSPRAVAEPLMALVSLSGLQRCSAIVCERLGDESRDRERRHLDPCVVEAGAAAQIAQRVRRESGRR